MDYRTNDLSLPVLLVQVSLSKIERPHSHLRPQVKTEEMVESASPCGFSSRKFIDTSSEGGLSDCSRKSASPQMQVLFKCVLHPACQHPLWQKKVTVKFRFKEVEK